MAGLPIHDALKPDNASILGPDPLSYSILPLQWVDTKHQQPLKKGDSTDWTRGCGGCLLGKG